MAAKHSYRDATDIAMPHHLCHTESVHEVVEGHLVVAVVYPAQEPPEHFSLNPKL